MHKNAQGGLTPTDESCSIVTYRSDAHSFVGCCPRFELFYKPDGTVDLWDEDVYDAFLDVPCHIWLA